MEVGLQLFNFFGIPLIESAETFPELLGYFLTCLMSIFIVFIVIKSMMNASWFVSKNI